MVCMPHISVQAVGSMCWYLSVKMPHFKELLISIRQGYIRDIITHDRCLQL